MGYGAETQFRRLRVPRAAYFADMRGMQGCKVAGAIVATLVAAAGCSSDHEHAGSRATTSTVGVATTVSGEQARRDYEAAAALVPQYELGSVPAGYAPGTPEAAPGFFRVVYPKSDASFNEGKRLSLTVEPAANPLGYPQLEAVTVRGGKPAEFFVVGDANDVHARHGLSWIETPEWLISLFAYADDPSFFVQLAETVRRRQ